MDPHTGISVVYLTWRSAKLLAALATLAVESTDSGAGQPALSPVATATFFCGFGGCATGCLADINRDRHLDFFDITHFLALYNQQAAGADLAEPLGVFNFFDLAVFLDFFSQGCP